MENLTTEKAVEYLASRGLVFSQITLMSWRRIGLGPRFRRIGRRKIFYEKSALDEFVQGGGQ